MDNILFCVRFRAVRGDEQGVIVECRINADSYDEALGIAWERLAEREGYNPNEWTFCDTRAIYKVTREQYKKLEGLAYWIAFASYDRERRGEVEKEIGLTIRHIFCECDQLQISFVVQNAVIEFARDWRRYESEYLTSILEIDGGREE